MNAFEGTVRFSSKDDAGERFDFLAPCTYQTDGVNAVLSFIEPKGENSVATRTRVYMGSGFLAIRRQGDMVADFRFEKNKKTALSYATAQGTLEFEILTNSLEIAFDDFSATAKAEYDLHYQGEKTSSTKIEILVKKG